MTCITTNLPRNVNIKIESNADGAVYIYGANGSNQTIGFNAYSEAYSSQLLVLQALDINKDQSVDVTCGFNSIKKPNS